MQKCNRSYSQILKIRIGRTHVRPSSVFRKIISKESNRRDGWRVYWAKWQQNTTLTFPSKQVSREPRQWAIWVTGLSLLIRSPSAPLLFPPTPSNRVVCRKEDERCFLIFCVRRVSSWHAVNRTFSRLPDRIRTAESICKHCSALALTLDAENAVLQFCRSLQATNRAEPLDQPHHACKQRCNGLKKSSTIKLWSRFSMDDNVC